MIRAARNRHESIRDYPTYTIPEAASYLGMPSRTLRYWVSDRPVWRIAGSHRGLALLSFRDLAQAHYIEVVRKHFGLTLSKTRDVIEAAKQESKSQYPLLKKNILVFFKHIMMDKPARGAQPRRLVDLSQHPQLAIPDIVDAYATRIQWDSRGDVMRIFPWRYWSPGKDDRRPVSIDPEIMSGKLVITDTRIPVEIVSRRREGGETVPDLARDYHLPESSISEALRHLVPQAA